MDMIRNAIKKKHPWRFKDEWVDLGENMYYRVLNEYGGGKSFERELRKYHVYKNRETGETRRIDKGYYAFGDRVLGGVTFDHPRDWNHKREEELEFYGEMQR